jgi:hypothetical protein
MRFLASEMKHWCCEWDVVEERRKREIERGKSRVNRVKDLLLARAKTEPNYILRLNILSTHTAQSHRTGSSDK